MLHVWAGKANIHEEIHLLQWARMISQRSIGFFALLGCRFVFFYRIVVTFVYTIIFLMNTTFRTYATSHRGILTLRLFYLYTHVSSCREERVCVSQILHSYATNQWRIGATNQWRIGSDGWFFELFYCTVAPFSDTMSRNRAEAAWRRVTTDTFGCSMAVKYNQSSAPRRITHHTWHGRVYLINLRTCDGPPDRRWGRRLTIRPLTAFDNPSHTLGQVRWISIQQLSCFVWEKSVISLDVTL